MYDHIDLILLKFLKMGFKPNFGIETAMKEIIFNYTNKKFRAKDNNYTVKSMLKLKID